MRSVLSRIEKLEARVVEPQHSASNILPSCVQAWRHEDGKRLSYWCLDSMLRKLFCTSSMPMAEARAYLNAADVALFDALTEWEPDLPATVEAGGAFLERLVAHSPGWGVLVENSTRLGKTLADHWQLPEWTNRISVDCPPFGNARHTRCSLAGSVSQLVWPELSEAQQADEFLQASDCCANDWISKQTKGW